MPVEITLVRCYRQVSIDHFRPVEEGQCFYQCGCATRTFAYMFHEYGTTLIGLFSPVSYDCLGICPNRFVILCLDFVMYRDKSLEQVAYWCFRLAIQSVVLLLRGKQFYESCSTIITFCKMRNQLLLLRRIGLPFTH